MKMRWNLAITDNFCQIYQMLANWKGYDLEFTKLMENWLMISFWFLLKARGSFFHIKQRYIFMIYQTGRQIFFIYPFHRVIMSHIKKRYKNLKLHYIQKEFFDVGISEIETPLGNNVAVYDIDWTICDIVMNRKKIDTQIFTDGITRYFKSNNKNLRRLIKYSRILNIEEYIRKYIEVLSWLILKASRQR